MTVSKRPLSPHLQIYKPQLTSYMSILHRMSGIFLSLGIFILAYWLVAISAGPETYQQAQTLLSSWIGQLLLLGWTIALFYHLCNGIRHLCWDAGWGFGLKAAYTSGAIVWAMTFTLTLLVWILAYSLGGTQI